MATLPARTPSTIDTQVAAALADAVGVVGRPAVYKEAGAGPGVLVSVVVGPQPDTFRPAGGRNRVPGPPPAGAAGVNAPWHVEVSAAEVAQVNAGDTFTVWGWVVGSDAETADLVVGGLPRFGGAVWHCVASVG